LRLLGPHRKLVEVAICPALRNFVSWGRVYLPGTSSSETFPPEVDVGAFQAGWNRARRDVGLRYRLPVNDGAHNTVRTARSARASAFCLINSSLGAIDESSVIQDHS
jgi:hypothetical protein